MAIFNKSIKEIFNEEKKTETFCNQAEKRAEIEEVLAIAQRLTDAGYGDICFIEETGREKEINYEE